MNSAPTIKGDFWRCEMCGGLMSRLVPQGEHAARMILGRKLDCMGREIRPEGAK